MMERWHSAEPDVALSWPLKLTFPPSCCSREPSTAWPRPSRTDPSSLRSLGASWTACTAPRTRGPTSTIWTATVKPTEVGGASDWAKRTPGIALTFRLGALSPPLNSCLRLCSHFEKETKTTKNKPLRWSTSRLGLLTDQREMTFDPVMQWSRGFGGMTDSESGLGMFHLFYSFKCVLLLACVTFHLYLFLMFISIQSSVEMFPNHSATQQNSSVFFCFLFLL